MPPSETEFSPPATGGFSALHPEIIESHILTRLDGPSLASVACCSATLRRHSSPEYLWSNICHSTWPSTALPRVREVITGFPSGGPQAFFSEAFPLLSEVNLPGDISRAPPLELLSAVDIHHQGKLIFTKLQVTKTDSNWFLSSPFRIDVLDHKDRIPVPIEHPDDDDGQVTVLEGVTLSWILIDPSGRRAANLSSHNPIATQLHWLTGETQVRFASILTAAGQGDVQCRITVTCDGSSGKGMQVKEVRLEMEDIDGKHLNGKETLMILQGALEAEKRTRVRSSTAAEARRRHREFEEMKRERREKEKRKEVALDTLCVAFGVIIFAAFFILICI